MAKDTTDTAMSPFRVFLSSRKLLLACVSIAGLVPFTAWSVEIEMLPSDGAEIADRTTRRGSREMDA